MDHGKYTTILAPDMLDYIDACSTVSDPAMTEPSITQMRARYSALCAAFSYPYPAGLTTEDKLIESQQRLIACRRYYPRPEAASRPLILFFHGGGFILGDIDSHDSICADLAMGTGLDVLATDYALAPEHPFPAALDDGMAVVAAVMAAEPERGFILCGDSAGGWLAASIAHRLRALNDGRAELCLRGQVLIYPALGGDRQLPSYHEHAHAPLLSAAEIDWYYSQFFAHETLPPYLGPLDDDNFSNLPETICFAAACDPIHDDSMAYTRLITEAGGRARCYSEEGLIHGYLRARFTVKAAAESFERIVAACRFLATPG